MEVGSDVPGSVRAFGQAPGDFTWRAPGKPPTALARTSSMMLNRTGDNGHHCLVPDHRTKYPAFHDFV